MGTVKRSLTLRAIARCSANLRWCGSDGVRPQRRHGWPRQMVAITLADRLADHGDRLRTGTGPIRPAAVSISIPAVGIGCRWCVVQLRQPGCKRTFDRLGMLRRELVFQW